MKHTLGCTLFLSPVFLLSILWQEVQCCNFDGNPWPLHPEKYSLEEAYGTDFSTKAYNIISTTAGAEAIRPFLETDVDFIGYFIYLSEIYEVALDIDEGFKCVSWNPHYIECSNWFVPLQLIGPDGTDKPSFIYYNDLLKFVNQYEQYTEEL